MSDFDYKANYEAARDRAKELIESKKTFIGRESLEYVFPELKPNLPDKIYTQENDHSMRYGVNQDSNIEGMHEYIRKETMLTKLGEISIAVNSFTHNSANDFRAEGANKVISLVKEYIESL